MAKADPPFIQIEACLVSLWSENFIKSEIKQNVSTRSVLLDKLS